MSADAATPSREEQMLAELAELDLALARRVHAKAMAAEDVDDINALSRTYQRVARSLRQTLALKARLERDRQAGVARAARPFDAPAVGRRMVELRDAITRIGWTEHEPSAIHDLARELEEILGVLAFEPGFAERPLADQVVELCEKLELPTRRARGWRNLPQPPGLAEPGDYAARSLQPAAFDSG
jgi:hypothetical protein